MEDILWTENAGWRTSALPDPRRGTCSIEVETILGARIYTNDRGIGVVGPSCWSDNDGNGPEDEVQEHDIGYEGAFKWRPVTAKPEGSSDSSAPTAAAGGGEIPHWFILQMCLVRSAFAWDDFSDVGTIDKHLQCVIEPMLASIKGKDRRIAKLEEEALRLAQTVPVHAAPGVSFSGVSFNIDTSKASAKLAALHVQADALGEKLGRLSGLMPAVGAPVGAPVVETLSAGVMLGWHKIGDTLYVEDEGSPANPYCVGDSGTVTGLLMGVGERLHVKILMGRTGDTVTAVWLDDDLCCLSGMSFSQHQPDEPPNDDEVSHGEAPHKFGDVIWVSGAEEVFMDLRRDELVGLPAVVIRVAGDSVLVVINHPGSTGYNTDSFRCEMTEVYGGPAKMKGKWGSRILTFSHTKPAGL